MGKTWRVSTLLWAAVLSAGAVHAQIPQLPFEPGTGNLRVGPVRVHPFVGVGELYDDNVFLQPRAKRDDFITVITPGIVLHLPLRQHELALGYRAEALQFARIENEDTVRHTGRVQLKGRYPGGLSWYVQDEAKRTNERPNTEIEPLIDRDQNDGGAGFEYAFADRWAVGADYLNTVYDYRNQQPIPGGAIRDFGTELDRMEQLGTVDLFYLVQPKTALLVEYGYGEASYFAQRTARERDNITHLARAGLRGDLTAKITALVKMGFQRKDFDNREKPDFDGFVASGSVRYQPRERTLVTFLVDRSVPEASFRSLGDEFYVSELFVLRADQVLGEKIRAYAEGSVANHDYQRSIRNDDFYGGTVGLRYDIQPYLYVAVQYLFERRDSNLDFDYTDNRIFLTVMGRL